MADIFEQIISGEREMPVLTNEEITELAQKLSPTSIAIFAQAMTEVSTVWSLGGSRKGERIYTADTEHGKYTIHFLELEGVMSAAVRTPLTGDGLGEIDVEIPEDQIAVTTLRFKKRCEAQMAWLATHDTSYEEPPEDINF